ncbi:putative baseplate assembly protein [Mucilaginibacter agri]|uniref:putative baseplate assembly protein n=1 Tax=Mucilaginibacter agri TaxID=2695265 RepID=UPI001AA1768A|nr:putative baseplate assembly protein [Mucilaginibacter agri]
MGVLTPEDTTNFPGLSALKYRVGRHYSFKESMLASISTFPALSSLTARSDDDMAIATLDSWAMVLDVLSFYQERIINEGYLRTATERLSVLELAKHISYRLKPGAAASTFFAFSMNEAPGAPLTAVIPVGTKIQSVPEQGQLPQTFETVEQIEAHVDWNSIKLQTRKRFIPAFGDDEIYLDGIVTGLQLGDGLLMIGDERANNVGNENWDFRKVKELSPDKDLNITKVTFDRGLGVTINDKKVNPAAKNFKIYALKQKASLFGYNAPDFKTLSGTIKNQFLPPGLTGDYFNGIAFDHYVFSRTDGNINFNWGAGSPNPVINADNFSVRWTGLILAPVSAPITFYTTSDDGVRLWVNDQSVFQSWVDQTNGENSGTITLQGGQFYNFRLEYYEHGGSAVITLGWSWPGVGRTIIPAQYFNATNYNDWPGYSISAISQEDYAIYLDALYPKIVKDSWLVISTGAYQEVYNVADVNESSRKGFTLALKTTKVNLLGENLVEQFDTHVRDAVVYAQSEELQITEMPVDDAIVDYQTITLTNLMPGLYAGQNIIFTGKRMRFQITTATGKPLFEVENNLTATRNLSIDDQLIILQKAESISPALERWTLQDSGGFVGTIEVSPNTYTLLPSSATDDAVSELHIIKSIVPGADPTTIILNEKLVNFFDPATVGINANIAASTHGETKTETLGSGDSSKVFQKFALKQSPLTYVSDVSASGVKSTLQVRVNDILWKEVPSFYGIQPKEKVFITSVADDGTVTIEFGDGITGARLPTGTGNVAATYRVGIGSGGLLKAGQLSMLLTPQLGVNKVANPLATSGAADPETLDDARENSPITVLTLDRIVSVKDFENFTRAFAGIGKALAEMIWNGNEQEVYITIAGADTQPVDELSDLYKNLVLAVQASGHNYTTVSIHSYNPITFSVVAGIKTDADYLFDKVKEQVILALQQAFSFESRAFGQDVTLAEVMTVIQSVKGVIYVDINSLDGADPFSASGSQRIVSNTATLQNGSIVSAQLLTINEITINQIL